MYFINRFELGKTLAGYVYNLRGQEPVILCLKEGALSVSISLASELRGWVYPLLTEPLVIPGDNRVLGVINQDGNLCYNMGLSTYEREELEMDYQSVIQEASRQAFSNLNKRTSEYGQLNKAALSGRTVVLVGDVVRDQLEISAAREFLKTVATQSIVSLVGNIDTESSNAFFLESDNSTFLDVMPYMFDDDHYFEQPDEYSLSERRLLAMNISQYWI